MSAKIFLGLSLVLAFLQGTLLPSVFLEGALLVWFFFANAKNLFAPVFLAGLIFDMVGTATLGTNALLFLLFTLVISYLSGRTALTSPPNLFILVFVFGFIRAQVLGLAFSPLWLAAAVLFLVFWLGRRPRVGEIQL